MRTNIFTPSPALRRRRWSIMLISLVVIALLALSVGRRWYAHYTQQAAQADLTAQNGALVLTPGDVAHAQVQTLIAGLPVTGTLRAKDTALITARLPGILRGLTVREGDAVREGQVIARVEPAEYDQRYQQAQLQTDAARAQMEIAKRQYDNNTVLQREGFISPTALAASRANLDAAQANYRAAQAGAAIARHSVADTVLAAPITGTVSRRLAQPGEHVVPQMPVVEIVDLSQLELQASISPGDSLAVRVGQTAHLTIEGAPDAVTATVTRINPSAQMGSRDVLVYLAMPAGLPGLRQGLFAQGVLETGQARALAVPLDAVRTDKPQPYVQVIKNGHVHLIPVQTGTRGTVRSAVSAADADLTAGDGETWVAVHVLGGPDTAASQPGASSGIAPGDWVLRGTAGMLGEGTAVKLPQSQ